MVDNNQPYGIMVAEIRLKMPDRYSFTRIADSRYDEAFGAPRVNIPVVIRERLRKRH